MNPFVGPGGIVQVQVGPAPDGRTYRVNLPDGWKLVGNKKGAAGKDGKLYFSVQVPAKADAKKYTVSFSIPKLRAIQTEVEVVRRVGG